MTATIELNSARKKLCSALGDKQRDYFAHMKSWFRKRISKEEFDVEARKLMTSENGHLHNEFLLAILNKCQTLASFQPSISMTNKASTNVETITSQSVTGRMASKAEPPAAKMACTDPSSLLIPRRYEGDDRLKIGCSMRPRYKSNQPFFDQRLQPESLSCVAPDLDEIHADNANVENTEYPVILLAQREPTLPDAGLIHGRLLMAAWEEGTSVARTIVFVQKRVLLNNCFYPKASSFAAILHFLNIWLCLFKVWKVLVMQMKKSYDLLF